MTAPQLESWIHRQWSHRGPVACLLYPFSLVFHSVSESRRRKTVPNRLPVPVVVVGNIYVGGTGKTPVTIELVKELRDRGWRPGVISRGFRRDSDDVRMVEKDSSAEEVGDEPLLIAQASGAPVAVGRERYKAGLLLLEKHPEVDVIISDDGLQHLALARDVELAVVGARGLGNGWVMPAGPLREPPSRFDSVDAIVLNTPNADVVSSRTPRFVASTCFGACTQLATGDTRDIDDLAHELEETGGRALAAAGIASPGRFFAMVKAHDIDCAELELGDHFDFRTNPFAERKEDIILITAKDAVKCRANTDIVSDRRLWIVSLEMKLDEALVNLVEEKIGKPKFRAALSGGM